MYTKNLEQLLLLLQSSRQSGLLTVESSEQDGDFWQAQFRLVEGNVMGCLLFRRTDGQVLLRDEEALRWLITQGKLNWNMEEGTQSPNIFLPPLPLRESLIGERRKGTEQPEWIPRRTLKGVQTSATSLRSLEQRQVFILANGHSTAEGITRLLRKPPDVISRILKDLREAGLIE